MSVLEKFDKFSISVIFYIWKNQEKYFGAIHRKYFIFFLTKGRQK